MSRGLVLAVNPACAVSAVETMDGVCAVFKQPSGATVLAGDVVEGALLAQGSHVLQHVDGACVVVGVSGALTRLQALEWVRGGGDARHSLPTPKS